MNRRFVAIGLPDDLRTAIDVAVRPVRAQWPELAWTDPAGWHVTLAFLGELDDDRVGDAEGVIADALRAFVEAQGSAGVVQARIGAGTRFGGRVLSLEVVDEPHGALAALGAGLQTGLQHAQLPVSRRDVRPHVTLARSRHKRPVTDALVRDVNDAIASSMERGGRTQATLVAGWPVTGVALWTAHDREGPAIYEVTTAVAVPGAGPGAS